MNNQTADLLIRIKNASMVGKTTLILPHSRMKVDILSILKKEGFVSDYEIAETDGKKVISVTLSDNHKPSHIKQISKPGHRIYAKAKDIKTPLRGFGLLIVSTPQGVITAKEANKIGIGGELICEIW